LDRNDHAATKIVNAQECITIAYTLQVILRNIPNLGVTVGGVSAPFKQTDSVLAALASVFDKNEGGSKGARKTPSKAANSSKKSSKSSTKRPAEVAQGSAKKAKVAKAAKAAPKTEVKKTQKKKKVAVRRKSLGGA
jgi:D-alanyl-D-alanine carboxypeptidase